MPKRRVHGGDAGHRRGNRSGAGLGRQTTAKKGQEVERAIDRHAQRDRRRHHAANVEGGAGPSQEPKEEDHRKHVGDHRHRTGHHAPLHRHHHQRDHPACRKKTREQVVEECLLDRVDQAHHAGVVGPYALRGAAVGRHDRLHVVADHLQEIAVVDARKRGGAGGDPPELFAIDATNHPQLRKAGEARLEFAGDHRLPCRRERARRRLLPRHEERRRHHTRHTRQSAERRPHFAHHVESLRRTDLRCAAEPQQHFHRRERTDVLLQPAVVADHPGLGREQRVDRHRRADPRHANSRDRHRRHGDRHDRRGEANRERGEPGRRAVVHRLQVESPSDRPARKEPRDHQKEHGKRSHHSYGRVEPKHADRLEFADDERDQPERRRTRGERAGQPAGLHRPQSRSLRGPLLPRLDEVIDEVNAPRHAEREHQQRHHDQHRVHPVAPGRQ